MLTYVLRSRDSSRMFLVICDNFGAYINYSKMSLVVWDNFVAWYINYPKMSLIKKDI